MILTNSVPTAKALDLFRPGYDIHQNPILAVDQRPYTARINITFRFYRPGESLFTTRLSSADDRFPSVARHWTDTKTRNSLL
jgi:hypothetical protein